MAGENQYCILLLSDQVISMLIRPLLIIESTGLLYSISGNMLLHSTINEMEFENLPLLVHLTTQFLL